MSGPAPRRAGITAGAVVSHYRVIEELGHGGMGIVYKAEDTRLRRHVALKFLPPELVNDRKILERFRQEARTASALDHPNICTIYDIDEHDQQPFIVMQLLEGATLHDRINGKPLKTSDVLDYGIQILDALDRAHAKGIVHADIKPRNVFITMSNQAKILDFGLARFRSRQNKSAEEAADLSDGATVRSDFGTTGFIVGTISHMSPEQALGESLDARSDLFSVGVVLYEMATGKLPFEGNSAVAVMHAIAHEQPVDPVSLNPSVPPALAAIIGKALAKAPQDRFQTAMALCSELRRLRDELNAASFGSAPIAKPGRVPGSKQSMEHPDHIGKYVVEAYLGGGMSKVYRAKAPLLDKTVVVKVLKAEASADPEARSRFLREAQLAAKIDHPNIITVFPDFGEHEGQPYMVMEFLRGSDLRTLIKNNTTGDAAGKLKIALQIAKAMQYVHSQNIVHRDIKPENIHVNESGVVKLMDFGIAKTQDLSITRDGFTMGTPYYMPPEQVLGKAVTHLADIYAFGVLMFELFVGSRPITGDDINQVFFRILNEPIDLKPLEAAAPPAVVALVGACTAKDPAQRPQDFGEIWPKIAKEIEALEAPARSAAPTPTPGPAPSLVAAPAGSNRLLWAAGALVVVAAGVVALLLLRPSTGDSKKTGSTTQQTTVTPPPPPPPALMTPAGEVALVPAGTFLSGKDKQPSDLGAFYIQKTEVTNESYARFCAETANKQAACVAAAHADHPDFPVVNVTIDDAKAFARWAGMRLPTAKEWEKAARGTDGRDYPWGNDRKPQFANVDLENGRTASLASVTSFPAGDSVFGIRQMAGNVWEFVDEKSTPSQKVVDDFRSEKLLNPPPTRDEPWYLMMGGSYQYPLQPGLTYDSASVPGRMHSTDIGFRCVKDVKDIKDTDAKR